MKLAPSAANMTTKDSSSSSKVVRPKPSTYAKFLPIDVSSPLGQYIYSLSNNTKDVIDISSLCMAERKSALRSVIPQNTMGNGKVASQSNYMPPLFEGLYLLYFVEFDSWVSFLKAVMVKSSR